VERAEAGLHFHGGVGSNGGGMSINPSQAAFFTGDSPILNWLKTSGNYGLNAQKAAVVISNASPASINYVAHATSIGTTIVISAISGAAGLSNGNFFVQSIIDADHFTVSATNGGAAINTTTAGTATIDLHFSGSDAFNTGYLDSNGNLIGTLPAQVKSVAWNFNSQDNSARTTGFPNYANQVFNVSWTGTATGQFASFTGNTGTGQASSFGANSGTLTVGANGTSGANFGLQLNITNPNDPPQNIKVYQSQYATNVGNGEFWNPDFLLAIQPFGSIRFMGMMNTVTSRVTSYAQLADANYFYFNQPYNGSGGNGTFGAKGELHPSIICDLLNRTKSNGHFCVPMGATDAFVTSVATYFRDNLSGALWMRFEFSNENWNPGASNFFYCRGQPYPPNQAAVTITGITAANPGVATVGSTAALGTVGSSPLLQFSVTGTMSTVLTADPLFNFGHTVHIDSATQFTITGVDTTGLAFTAGTVKLAGFGEQWAGYRAAHLWKIVKDVYGPSRRSSWRGSLGSQTVNTAVTQAGIDGINWYLANEAPGGTIMADVMDEVLGAPYFLPFVGSVDIQSITPGATTTINANAHGYGAGSKVRIFVSVDGTVHLNNQGFTISTVTTNSFVIPINTTGSVYSGTMWLADGNFFQIMDDSLTNFTNTPATYPTKYTYFANQMGSVAATGTCTGGFTDGGSFSFTNNGDLTGGLGAFMASQALLTNSNSLKLEDYEAGANLVLIGTNIGNNAQALDYAFNYLYEPGTAGKPGVSQGYTAYFAASRAVLSTMPVQFNLDGQPGPWTALRSFADTGNKVYQTLAAQNALGPFVDPTAAATGTYIYSGNATNKSFANNSGNTDTLSTAVIGTSAALVIVPVAITGGSITSVVIDGITATLDVSGVNGDAVAIYSAVVGVGANTRTVTVNYSSAGFQNREFYVLTARNLSSTLVRTHSTGNLQNTAVVDVTKGALVLAISSRGTNFGPTSGVLTPSVSLPATATVAFDIASGVGSAAMGMFNSSFSSKIFSVSATAGNIIAVATYR